MPDQADAVHTREQDFEEAEEAKSVPAVQALAPSRTPSAFSSQDSKVSPSKPEAAAKTPLGGGRARSRKSMLLRESRRRCGIRTPEARRRPEEGEDREEGGEGWVAISPEVQEIVGGGEEEDIELLMDDDDDDVFAEDGEV